MMNYESGTFLSQIVDRVRETLQRQKRERPLEALERQLEKAPPPRSLVAALRRTLPGRVGLICEYKRASPSRGLIRGDLSVSHVVSAYEKGGARALSVLTEPTFFGGQDRYIARARRISSLPILRKDFILEPYQVIESRALGADALLLIQALHPSKRMEELLALTHSLGMEALVEVHDESELDLALKQDVRLIGINNRDLDTFETDLSVSEGLIDRVPTDVEVVSESGIRERADIERLKKKGIRHFLVGESLMRSDDPGQAASALQFDPRPITKICGLQTREAVETALDAGASALGFVFADSPRQVSPATARDLIAHGRRYSRNHYAVGVFVDTDPAMIRSIVQTAGLDAVQLHGAETPEICKALSGHGFGVYKTARVRAQDDGFGAEWFRAYERAGVDLFLFDTLVPGQAGGTGQTFDWSIVPDYRKHTRVPFLVAGGLTPLNVQAALATSQADGVDVSGGVECQGKKDPARIRAFLGAARDHVLSLDQASKGECVCPIKK